ncbi:MAG: nitrite reductase small subunit NirD [Proteobacteria bacterium]|nr:nitrite reductase small subunit NirD [Pseudomonadota bacterium]HQR04281.1 nitrite reductase small subunit NirD [Rhodocyclaceae bacterium]
MNDWLKICPLDDIPRLGARVVNTGKGDIAVFRNAEDEVFALNDKCPHKGGPLSQGIVYDRRVACPLHGMTVHLDSGKAQAPDEGCTQKYRVRVDKGVVFLNLGP